MYDSCGSTADQHGSVNDANRSATHHQTGVGQSRTQAVWLFQTPRVVAVSRQKQDSPLLHQKPSNFHQRLPTTEKISKSTTHMTKPTRHHVPIVT